MGSRARAEAASLAGTAKRPRTLLRLRSLRGLLAIFLIGLFRMASSAAGKGNSTYDGTVDFGAQIVQLDDDCLAVDGKITSGAFFEDLKRVEVGRQFEFRKHGRAVTEYPESLTTSILITSGQCEPSLSNSASSIFHGNSYALRFQAEWKDGMKLRSAALVPVATHCTGYSSIHAPGQVLAASSILCQLTVESKGVPLSDHLIVSIFSPDGKRLTRLSARP
jgi:hypothetical protein